MKKPLHEAPIGIFDSGIGGLTVLKELVKKLPLEHTIYIGDTARVPYGARSPETVIKYSLENARFLMSKGIKLLIVACNTSSSVALSTLKKNLSIPVVGVVEPGARAAVAKSKSKRIAVIGTETTIKSNSYKKALLSINKAIKVKGIACPLFVPLVEENWLTGDVVTSIAEKYLSPIKKFRADTLILGCTHYPLLKKVIAKVVKLSLIDSAEETASEVQHILEEMNIIGHSNSSSLREFFVTDAPEKFVKIGEKFLGHPITNIRKVTLPE